jgi:class 3 adenylate cyclase
VNNEPHRAHIVAMFTDMTDFRTFAETADPELLFDKLQQHHRLLGETIDGHGGQIIEFNGDGVLAVFNDRVPLAEPEHEAIAAALALREAFTAVARTWEREGIKLGFKVGLDAGYATLGRVGYEGHPAYGVVGRVVIGAALITRIARSGQILASQRCAAAVGERLVTRALEDVVDRKLSQPLKLVEILGLKVAA